MKRTAENLLLAAHCSGKGKRINTFTQMSPTKEVCYCMKPVLASLWQTSPEKLPLADYYFFTDICHQPLLSSVCTDPLQELNRSAHTGEWRDLPSDLFTLHSLAEYAILNKSEAYSMFKT